MCTGSVLSPYWPSNYPFTLRKMGLRFKKPADELLMKV